MKSNTIVGLVILSLLIGFWIGYAVKSRPLFPAPKMENLNYELWRNQVKLNYCNLICGHEFDEAECLKDCISTNEFEELFNFGSCL